MPPDPSSPPPPPPAPPQNRPEAKVVIHPMPKIVFFYLTWLASIACGVLRATSDVPPPHLGTIWLGIFTLNLLVISFEFSEATSIAVVLGIVAFVLAGLYFGFAAFVGRFVSGLRLDMNAEFYLAIATVFSVLYLVVWVRSRFDYWEFRHNEVLHRSGIFGEIKRYSTEDLRWFKEIPDVLERLLLGSGRMVLTTPREPTPMVIQHVLWIEKKDDRIAEMLGSKRVTFK